MKADFALNPHDIPIPEHAKVLSYVEVMQGRMRDYIQESLARGAKYMPMIQAVFRAEGLPLDLAYIPIIESSFKTNALSKASAKGPWQFMKPTAKDHGLKTDWFIDERSDPEKSTVAAAKYLKTLSKMFDGDWNLVLAAYNGGPGRVSRAMKRSGIDDFWSLSATSKYLPRETREYVPLIMAAMIVGRNPAQYGFEAVTAEPMAYDKVALPQAIDLRRVAEWAGTSVDEIQALNPELRRWTTPVKYPNYEVKVPKGTADRLNAKLADASPADFSALKWYTAKKGETLLTVARRFGVSRTDVAEANNLTREVAPAPRPGADHPARARDAARRADRARRPDRRRVARDRGARRSRRRHAPRRRSRRSPTRSSAATRSSRSRSSSTPPSRRSRAGTACSSNRHRAGREAEDPRREVPAVQRRPDRLQRTKPSSSKISTKIYDSPSGLSRSVPS